MPEDIALLRRYADDRDEVAFAQLVGQKVDGIYSVALRRVGGDAHLARDVTQQVFAALARDARKLAHHPVLTGWLYTTTRHIAANTVRGERRRKSREQEAQAMKDALSNGPTEADWNQVAPVLEDAIDELAEPERMAVWLRFFDRRSFGEIGKTLQLTEDAARKRVERALEKLRTALGRRGITSTSAALSAALGQNAVMAAPEALGAAIASSVVPATAAGASGSAIGIQIFQLMSTSKTIFSAASVVLIAAVAITGFHMRIAQRADAEASAALLERNTARQNLDAANSRIAGLESDIAALRSKAASTSGSTAGPTAVQANSSSVVPGLNGLPRLVLSNQSARSLYLEANRKTIRARYDQFFKSSGFNAAQQEQLVQKVSEIIENELDVQELFASNELTKNPDAMTKARNMVNENRQQNAKDILQMLGDEGYKRFGDYTHRSNARPIIDQLAGRLYYTDFPLQSAQAAEISSILVDARQNSQTAGAEAVWRIGGEDLPRSLISDYDKVTWMKDERAWPLITDAAIARAANQLSPPQLAALQQLQAEQLIQIKLAPVRLNKPPGG